MDHTHYNPVVRADRLLMLVGPLVVVVLIAWLAGFSGPEHPSAAATALWVLFTSAPLALCWLVAAFGYGWPLRRWLLGEGPDDWAAIDMGLGVAFMLVLDAGLGALGVLQESGGFGAWVVVLIGFGLVIVQLRRVLRPSALLPWPVWAAAPAIAVLLLAVCSAPGWLWATEFGGYDALSYHLQLPKEWLALGRITPLDHNVYSYLPSYVEAAYYHLAVLHGDAVASVYACQLLHAGFTLLTAAVVGRIAWRAGGRAVGAAAAVVVLGTPWTVVAGSLGYNDMAVAFLLATGLLVIQIAPPDSPRRGAAVGVLATAACGAKLTAIGFVAVPLGLLMLAAVPPKRWLAPVVGAAVAAVICLLPYLVRNWVYSGNPVFPFATGLLGLGHWTQQQAEIWTRPAWRGMEPACPLRHRTEPRSGGAVAAAMVRPAVAGRRRPRRGAGDARPALSVLAAGDGAGGADGLLAGHDPHQVAVHASGRRTGGTGGGDRPRSRCGPGAADCFHVGARRCHVRLVQPPGRDPARRTRPRTRVDGRLG
ncbi:MAG: hypothetical protein ACYS15_12765 [Planctomycetota bacterium]|jgi:hypothetical protein